MLGELAKCWVSRQNEPRPTYCGPSLPGTGFPRWEHRAALPAGWSAPPSRALFRFRHARRGTHFPHRSVHNVIDVRTGCGDDAGSGPSMSLPMVLGLVKSKPVPATFITSPVAM